MVEALEIYLTVVREGSLLAASRVLDISRSQIRRRLEQLEREAGAPLLARTSEGGLEATPAGRALVTEGPELIGRFSALMDAARSAATTPTRQIRAALPVGLPIQVETLAAQALGRLRAEFPGVRYAVRRLEDPHRAIPGEAELAIGFRGDPPEVPCRTLQVWSCPLRVVASRRLLEAKGEPSDVEALLRQDPLVAWRGPTLHPHRWPLRDGGWVSVRPHGVDPSPCMLYEFARQSSAFVLLPLLPVFDLEADGVVEVLGDQIGAELPVVLSVLESVCEEPPFDTLLTYFSLALPYAHDRTLG